MSVIGRAVAHSQASFTGFLLQRVIYRVSQEECARFGRVFLMLKYTDITQNTYVQSGAVTEIMAREV